MNCVQSASDSSVRESPRDREADRPAGFGCLPDTGPFGRFSLTPLPPKKTDIFFESGGRIVSIKADGSGRQLLASRFSKIENTDLGYTEPAVSPDGDRVAFVNRRSGAYFDGYVADVLVANADGTGVVKVLSGDRENYYSAPSWSPDGERFIVTYYRKRGRKRAGSILSIKPNGSDRRIIFRLKKEVNRGGFSFWPAAGKPVMSPDGTKVLFVRLADFKYDHDGLLEVADLGSGKTSVISRYSHGGSWSPDGSRIVHSKANTGDDEVCGSVGCETAGELMIVNADGTGSKNLLPGEGHEVDPDWSEDGSRIVFAANRNLPTSSDAYEIYSVKPDGGCLAWLTNGTPASVSPSWSVQEGASTVPASCGDNGLKTLPEVTVTPKVRGLEITNWMGDDFRGQLFSGRLGPVPGEHFTSLSYLDCSRFDPKRCGAGFTTLEFSTCFIRNSLAGFVGDRKVRGVPTFNSEGDGTTQVGAYSGEGFLLVMHETNNRYFSNHELLRGIRPFDSTTNPRRLPPPVFPAAAIRRMNKVIRVHRRTGSVARTSRVLGMAKKSVLRNLKLRAALLRYGPIRTVECPKVPR